MITAVDSSVLLDIFKNDPKFCQRSADAMRQSIATGSLVACEIVWAEVSSAFADKKQFADIMEQLGVGFSPMSASSAIASGAAWLDYRKNGGNRERMIPDFLIGAHALNQCDRLLTRDRGFYRKYFANLAVLDPTEK
ncbi:MAG: type II toxin-antitoxin system VapC family toxin [Gammaproteobacteria bacterium]|nr:type II toxin-antitoxin system VapC family toxin [Gammaproteobacteria bacterium]